MLVHSEEQNCITLDWHNYLNTQKYKFISQQFTKINRNIFYFHVATLKPLVDSDCSFGWSCWQKAESIVSLITYWAIQAGLLTPLTFAWHRLSPLAAFTSGAYFRHNGRR